MRAILDLDPFACARSLAPFPLFGNEALEAHLASGREQIGTDRAWLEWRDEDAFHGRAATCRVRPCARIAAAGADRRRRGRSGRRRRAQRVEIRDAAEVENDDFAVDREMRLAHLARGLGDEGIPPGPVEAGLGLEPDAIAGAHQAGAVSVILISWIQLGPDGTAPGRPWEGKTQRVAWGADKHRRRRFNAPAAAG